MNDPRYWTMLAVQIQPELRTKYAALGQFLRAGAKHVGRAAMSFGKGLYQQPAKFIGQLTKSPLAGKMETAIAGRQASMATSRADLAKLFHKLPPALQTAGRGLRTTARVTGLASPVALGLNAYALNAAGKQGAGMVLDHMQQYADYLQQNPMERWKLALGMGVNGQLLPNQLSALRKARNI